MFPHFSLSGSFRDECFLFVPLRFTQRWHFDNSSTLWQQFDTLTTLWQYFSPQVHSEMGSAVSVDGPVLRLTNARVGDRGMYVCDATNVAGQARAATIIDVERECAFLCFYSNKKKFWKNQIFIDVKYTSTSNVSVLFCKKRKYEIKKICFKEKISFRIKCLLRPWFFTVWPTGMMVDY